MTTNTSDSASESAFVQATYEQLAQLGESGLCCSPLELYSPEELAALPDDVLRLSSGCGHPVDDADIEPGTTVLDIGSGAGADCILAAQRVGPTGTVIGIDPSPSMRALATTHRDRLGLSWIDFRDGRADALPVPDDSVDLVISNCVLSLSTDPTATWAEIGRVLTPGGQVVVSDIVGGPAGDVVAKARCETGVDWPEYRETLRATGFSGIQPLRVRAARFRDGTTTQSVTFRARHGMPAPHAGIDVLYRQPQRAIADRLARGLAEAGRRAGASLSIRLIDVHDPAHSACAALLFTAAGFADVTAGPAISLDAAITAIVDDAADIETAVQTTLDTLTGTAQPG